MSKQTAIRLIQFSVVLLIALIVSYFVIPKPQEFTTASQETPEIGGNFELIDEEGVSTRPSSFDGRHLLIYFGFTYCPDVCPTSLGVMSDAYATLDPDLQDKIVPVFITVDPQRDTQEQMKEYVSLFHEDLKGLTGSQEQIDEVIELYRVYARKVLIESEDDYQMEHSGYLYVTGPDGRYVSHFSGDATPDEITKKLSQILG